MVRWPWISVISYIWLNFLLVSFILKKEHILPLPKPSIDLTSSKDSINRRKSNFADLLFKDKVLTLMGGDPVVKKQLEQEGPIVGLSMFHIFKELIYVCTPPEILYKWN